MGKIRAYEKHNVVTLKPRFTKVQKNLCPKYYDYDRVCALGDAYSILCERVQIYRRIGLIALRILRMNGIMELSEVRNYQNCRIFFYLL